MLSKYFHGNRDNLFGATHWGCWDLLRTINKQFLFSKRFDSTEHRHFFVAFFFFWWWLEVGVNVRLLIFVCCCVFQFFVFCFFFFFMQIDYFEWNLRKSGPFATFRNRWNFVFLLINLDKMQIQNITFVVRCCLKM